MASTNVDIHYRVSVLRALAYLFTHPEIESGVELVCCPGGRSSGAADVQVFGGREGHGDDADSPRRGPWTPGAVVSPLHIDKTPERETDGPKHAFYLTKP